jgi:hypothetical protein
VCAAQSAARAYFVSIGREDHFPESSNAPLVFYFAPEELHPDENGPLLPALMEPSQDFRFSRRVTRREASSPLRRFWRKIEMDWRS